MPDEHFVHAWADALDDADGKVLPVPMEPADSEAALIAPARQKAPQADGPMGRWADGLMG